MAAAANRPLLAALDGLLAALRAARSELPDESLLCDAIDAVRDASRQELDDAEAAAQVASKLALVAPRLASLVALERRHLQRPRQRTAGYLAIIFQLYSVLLELAKSAPCSQEARLQLATAAAPFLLSHWQPLLDAPMVAGGMEVAVPLACRQIRMAAIALRLLVTAREAGRAAEIFSGEATLRWLAGVAAHLEPALESGAYAGDDRLMFALFELGTSTSLLLDLVDQPGGSVAAAAQRHDAMRRQLVRTLLRSLQCAASAITGGSGDAFVEQKWALDCLSSCASAVSSPCLLPEATVQLQEPRLQAQVLRQAVAVITGLPLASDAMHAETQAVHWKGAGSLLVFACDAALESAQRLPASQRAAREASVRWTQLRVLPKLFAVLQALERRGGERFKWAATLCLRWSHLVPDLDSLLAKSAQHVSTLLSAASAAIQALPTLQRWWAAQPEQPQGSGPGREAVVQLAQACMRVWHDVVDYGRNEDWGHSRLFSGCLSAQESPGTADDATQHAALAAVARELEVNSTRLLQWAAASEQAAFLAAAQPADCLLQLSRSSFSCSAIVWMMLRLARESTGQGPPTPIDRLWQAAQHTAHAAAVLAVCARIHADGAELDPEAQLYWAQKAVVCACRLPAPLLSQSIRGLLQHAVDSMLGATDAGAMVAFALDTLHVCCAYGFTLAVAFLLAEGRVTQLLDAAAVALPGVDEDQAAMFYESAVRSFSDLRIAAAELAANGRLGRDDGGGGEQPALQDLPALQALAAKLEEEVDLEGEDARGDDKWAEKFEEQRKRALPHVVGIAQLLEHQRAAPEQVAADRLALAQAAATRCCAYLRCSALGVGGGAGAGEGEGSLRCSVCRVAWYCGTACSHADWREGHRKVCKALREARLQRQAEAKQQRQQQQQALVQAASSEQQQQ